MTTLFVVKLGSCSGHCPEIWEIDPGNMIYPDEPYDGEQARFATRKEAEDYIRTNWGEYPVTCY